MAPAVVVPFAVNVCAHCVAFVEKQTSYTSELVGVKLSTAAFHETVICDDEVAMAVAAPLKLGGSESLT